MIRVAWLTCAFLSVSVARVFERCELATELTALGVRPEHLSTWVCIAYHESRFDTAANNRYSGDHGLFQISELYWCGPGKACGLPCSALRDDDISDDLDCALVVHEEHTRLQGNGFLAWVVYPQHCKHNTKKYLVDCDINAKKSVPIARSRSFHYPHSYDHPNVTTHRHNANSALPTYLSVGSIVRENYGKVLDHNRERTDWYNYKIDNIDELQLPVFQQPSQHIDASATTTYVPPVMVWRSIESNQFRKKQTFGDTSTQTPTTRREYATKLQRYATSTKATSIQVTSTTRRPLAAATSTTSPRTLTATPRPTTRTFTTTAGRPATFTTSSRPPTSTTYRPASTALSSQQWYSITAQEPTTTSVAPRTVTATYRSPFTISRNPSTTTRRPTTPWTRSSTTSNILGVTEKAVSVQPKTEFSWHTSASRISTTPATTTVQRVAGTKAINTQPFAFLTTKRNDAQTRTTRAATYSSNKPPTSTHQPTSTQSIFDLYLNPTKAPQLPSYKYSWGQSRLKIFAGGTTTTPATARSAALAQDVIKRQI